MSSQNRMKKMEKKKKNWNKYKSTCGLIANCGLDLLFGIFYYRNNKIIAIFTIKCQHFSKPARTHRIIWYKFYYAVWRMFGIDDYIYKLVEKQ